MSSSLEPSVGFQSHLESRLNAWSARFGSPFILALSGGGDSMALALGCATWVARGKGQVQAICVDHGLREGSAQEAQQSVIWAQALGLPASSVLIDLSLGQSRLQERARAGRHQALCKAAQKAGARVILLAHNREDQQETLALRLASKTRLDGLAGISELAPSPFYDSQWPCLVGRPLLDFGRDELRALLKAAGQNWHDDPSNRNLAFARILARRRLANLKAQGSDVTSFSRIAKHATALRVSQDDAGRALLSRADVRIEHGHISVSSGAFLKSERQLVERALGWLAFCLGGQQRLPEASKMHRLYSAIMSPDFRGATLAGAKFTLKNDRLIVTAAALRNGQKQAHPAHSPSIDQRLAAISADLDQFVTLLG
jgi:tRNA(Ile)-lysidine synthase